MWFSVAVSNVTKLNKLALSWSDSFIRFRISAIVLFLQLHRLTDYFMYIINVCSYFTFFTLYHGSYILSLLWPAIASQGWLKKILKSVHTQKFKKWLQNFEKWLQKTQKCLQKFEKWLQKIKKRLQKFEK